MTVVAYHGDGALRARLLRELAWHKRIDAIAQGSGGRFADGIPSSAWRGCAVACSLRSMKRAQRAFSPEREDYYDHDELAKSMGVPVELLHLEDRIFEGLLPDLAREWPQRFARAIKPGADLSLVWPRFAVVILSDPERGVQRHTDARGKAAIATVVALLERRIAGDEPGVGEWRWAARAARAARLAGAAWEWAARAAEAAAARAAGEWAAAAAAEAAAEAAEAAEAAGAHYSWMADMLETLLRAA